MTERDDEGLLLARKKGTGLLLDDHALASGTGADKLDRDAEELFDVLDVLAARLRQVLVLGDVLDRLLPSGQGDVLDLDAGENVQVGGEKGRERFAVEVVRDRDLDLFEVVEDVELGQVQRGVAVDHVRVLHDDEVEPAAAATTARRDTKLGTDLLEVLADLLFSGRERKSVMSFGEGKANTQRSEMKDGGDAR